MPNIFIIGGCNGSGKTTAAKTLLPDLLECSEFVNADAIAAGISPFQPDNVAFLAGRLMLERIKYLAAQKIDFAFETTLSTKSYVPFLKNCQESGYKIVLIFLYLSDIDIAIQRVAERVRSGGHNVPADVIFRRYNRGLDNLNRHFLPMADVWLLYDNSGTDPVLIAEGERIVENVVYLSDIYDELRKK